jgi:membrane-associated phospholipid phosphatase
MLTYGISLLVMVTSTQILKYLIKRARPVALSHTKRIGNLRKAEEGTYSMPSGDSAAASLFCFLCATVVGLPALYVILPLVMCGRVYY